MSSLSIATMGLLGAGSGGVDRYLPVSDVDVLFANRSLGVSLPELRTTALLPDNRVTLKMKSSRLVADIDQEELTALFPSNEITTKA